MEGREGLQVLRLPNIGENPEAYTIDIIFIHGLGADPIKNWQHENGFNWIRDALPADFPRARIMTFGYNANLFEDTSRGVIRDFALQLLNSLKGKRAEEDEKERPLILVGHSFGGLVAKQAMVTANIDKRFETIKRCCYALMFMATPHRGSGKASIGKLMMNIAEVSFTRPKTQLLQQLESDSLALQGLSDDFSCLHSQFQVVSFYEMKETHIATLLPEIMVVESFSAKMGIENEIIESMNADHSSICKFPDKESAPYEKFVQVLCEMIQKAEQVVPLRFLDPKLSRVREIITQIAPDDIIDPIDSLFHFHETRLDGTCNWIFSDPLMREYFNVHRNQQHLHFFLTGPPGCGKSMLSSRIIKQLIESVRGSPWARKGTIPTSDNLVLYFFCSNRSNDPRASDSNYIIASIIVQVLWANIHNDELLRLAEQLFPPRRSLGTDSTVPYSWTSLLNGLTQLINGPSWIVVDGIDESSDSGKLLEGLLQVCSSIKFSSRLLVSGRRDYPAWKQIQDWPCVSLSQEDSSIAGHDKDLQLYIETKIEFLASKIERLQTNQHLRAGIQAAFETLLSGIFIWVLFATETILQHAEEPDCDLLAAAKAIPSDLEDLYIQYMQGMFKRLSRSKPQLRRAIVALQWLLCSFRPLHVDEVITAIASSPGSETPCMEGIDSEGTLSIVLGSLVKFQDYRLSTEEQKAVEGNPKIKINHNRIITFAHSSFRDCLLNPAFCERVRTQIGISKFFLTVAEGHVRIAATCLSYLAVEGNIAASLRLPHGAQDADHPILDYAATYWQKHIQKGGSTSSKSILLQESLELFVLGAIRLVNSFFDSLDIRGCAAAASKSHHEKKNDSDDGGKTLSEIPSPDSKVIKFESNSDYCHSTRSIIDTIEAMKMFLTYLASRSNNILALASEISVTTEPPPLAPYDGRLVHGEDYYQNMANLVSDPEAEMDTRYIQTFPKFQRDPARAVELALREVACRFPEIQVRIADIRTYLVTLVEQARQTAIEISCSSSDAAPYRNALTVLIRAVETLAVFPVIAYTPELALNTREIYRYHHWDPMNLRTIFLQLQGDTRLTLYQATNIGITDHLMYDMARSQITMAKDFPHFPKRDYFVNLVSCVHFGIFNILLSPFISFILTLTCEFARFTVVSWFATDFFTTVISYLLTNLPDRILFPIDLAEKCKPPGFLLLTSFILKSLWETGADFPASIVWSWALAGYGNRYRDLMAPNNLPSDSGPKWWWKTPIFLLPLSGYLLFHYLGNWTGLPLPTWFGFFYALIDICVGYTTGIHLLCQILLLFDWTRASWNRLYIAHLMILWGRIFLDLGTDMNGLKTVVRKWYGETKNDLRFVEYVGSGYQKQLRENMQLLD